MENASKALVMAGGVLIAILVVSALLLMINQIGDYEKAQTGNVKDSQLAQFNYDFERYTDDNGITGADIITIINKIADFNNKEGVSNSVNYDINMSVTVYMDGFKTKYPTGSAIESILKGNKIETKDKYFSEIISVYSDYERKYTLEVMSKLASSYEELSKCTKSEYENAIKKITGKNNITKYPTIIEIGQYREYSDFKRANFVSCQDSVYENGQIRDLYFKFVK